MCVHVRKGLCVGGGGGELVLPSFTLLSHTRSHTSDLSLLHSLCRFDEAERLYARVVDGNDKVLGPDHPTTLAAVGNFATLLRAK
jgi:hypothetical protein